MQNLHFISTSTFYKDVLENIYKYNKDIICDFFYLEEMKFRTFIYNHVENKNVGKVIVPGELELDFTYNGKNIHIKHEYIYDKDNKIDKLMLVNDCGCTKGQILFTKLTLSSIDKKLLIDFVDESRKIVEKRRKTNRDKNNDTLRVYYYKEYWSLFSKIPKRPIDTLYLKEGEKENIVNSIAEFFSIDERNEYLSFGIPYKKVFFLYGVPGSGKTSSINTLASYFDCDIQIIPLSTDMDDSNLVEAFSSISNEEDKTEKTRKIILIEDIDCIFEDRKEGDHMKNKITLQGLLNCMDGFTCTEGALIFITANKPETLDNAVIRSCRVDYKLELGYADEYQTKNMFDRFLPEQSGKFNKFYNSISHLEYTTAMLQELLFFNRKCMNILDHIDEFKDIVKKNNRDDLKENKRGNNVYM
tara:strand:+ start:64 stop:1308 length:1245 start_codon:yes stop_codon:yes gene_type:complete